MYHLKIFLDLTRLTKPIGFMLLFWPCSWGLALAFNVNNLEIFTRYLILFFLGSVLMRSAGCIFNDIVDRNFDKKVNRTKQRPIPSGKISIKKSFFYVIVLCLLALIVLLQFNLLTIILGMSSMVLAFLYPYMKRITYWPQLFLGLTFNWGIIMAFAATENSISTQVLLLYFSAIFWTLGYDTIYGAQDMSDDEIIGLKSTAIKFKKNIKVFVGICYLIFFSLIVFLLDINLENNLLLVMLVLFTITLIYQLIIFNHKVPKTCLRAFKLNNLTGFFLFLAVINN